MSNEESKVEVPEELLEQVDTLKKCSLAVWPFDLETFQMSPLQSSDRGRDLSFFLGIPQGWS